MSVYVGIDVHRKRSQVAVVTGDRTRPTSRRSTAFSCRSTSNSASFARSPRATRTARPITSA